MGSLLLKFILIIIFFYNLNSLFASEILLIKYDKLTNSSGDSIGNTAGYDLTKLNYDYKEPIKIDKLLKNYPNLSINIADKSTWSGGADKNSPLYRNGFWSDNKKNNRLLAYYSDVILSRGTTLKFVLECGEIKVPSSGAVELYAYDNNVNRWIKVGFLIDFKTVYNYSNKGYTFLRFSINSTSERGGDHRFTLADGSIENEDDSDGHLPAKTLLAFASKVDSNGNISELEILPKRFTKCECLCDMKIDMTEAIDGPNSSLQAPLRGVKPISLLTFSDGWKAKITHFENGKRIYSPASSLIDISENVERRRFVPEGNDTSFLNDTYTLRSVFAIHLENEAEYGIDINSVNDLFKIRLKKDSYCAVRSVSFYTLNDSGRFVKREMYKDGEGFYFKSDFKDFPFQINNQTNDQNRVVIEVDGSHTICQGVWRVDFSIYPTKINNRELKLLEDENGADWRVDGMKFIVPYLNTDPNFGTFLVVTNKSDKSVNVYMDVVGDGGRNEGVANLSRYINIKLSDIPRRSTRIYFPNDFKEAILKKYPSFKAYRYFASFIVTANENDIEAAAFQQDGNSGKRSVSVLTESLHMENGKWKGHLFHQ